MLKSLPTRANINITVTIIRRKCTIVIQQDIMPIIAYLASKKDSNSTLPTILCYDIGMDQTKQAILDFNTQRDWDQFHSQRI